MQRPQPVTLQNEHVVLRPLSLDHAAEFFKIGQTPEIWTFLTPAPFKRVADAEAWVASMLARSEQQGDISFSVYDAATQKLAGSSSFLEVRPEHGGLEIGFTWYAQRFQRTHVNTATKLALLQHAFETLGANRVQLQTDARNERSQRAIARIGAKQEGVLRKHKVYPDGYVRDSVMFSVVADEWPDVRRHLEQLLAG